MNEGEYSQQHEQEKRQSQPFDAYQTLGLDRDQFQTLSPEDQKAAVKKGYREQVRANHPDGGDQNDPAEIKARTDRMAEVNQAYSFLKDEDKRAAEAANYRARKQWEHSQQEAKQARDQAKAEQQAWEAQATARKAERDQTAWETMKEKLKQERSTSEPMTDAETQRQQTLRNESVYKVNFNSIQDEKYYNLFQELYKRYAPGTKQEVSGEASAEDQRRAIAVELKKMTSELLKKHNMPPEMSKLYIRAMAECAKAVVKSLETPPGITLDDLQNSLEYKLLATYQKLAEGTMALDTLITEKTAALFETRMQPDGDQKLVLKKELTDADLEKLDEAVRQQIAQQAEA